MSLEPNPNRGLGGQKQRHKEEMESRGMNLLHDKEQHHRESLLLLPCSPACFPDAVAIEANAVVFEILLASRILTFCCGPQ